MKPQIDLFKQILADTYYGKQTLIEEKGDSLFISEPNRTDCLYCSSTIMNIADILHLTSYIGLFDGKLYTIVY